MAEVTKRAARPRSRVKGYAARRPRRAQNQPFSWRPLSFLGTNSSRDDGRDLFLYVGGGGEKWIAIAVEGPHSDDPIAFLGDHAHRLIGEFANPAAAQRAAEGFAKKWRRRAKIDACGCTDIR